MNYLMLDKSDITKVCGNISHIEIMKETNMNKNQLSNFLSHERLFRNKYILVEDISGSTRK